MSQWCALKFQLTPDASGDLCKYTQWTSASYNVWPHNQLISWSPMYMWQYSTLLKKFSAPCESTSNFTVEKNTILVLYINYNTPVHIGKYSTLMTENMYLIFWKLVAFWGFMRNITPWGKYEDLVHCML